MRRSSDAAPWGAPFVFPYRKGKTMKARMCACVCVGLLFLLATSVQASVLPRVDQQHWKLNVTNASELYQVQDPAGNQAIELRGVLEFTSAYQDFGNNGGLLPDLLNTDSGPPYVGSQPNPDHSMYAMIYDLELTGWFDSSAGVTLTKAAGTVPTTLAAISAALPTSGGDTLYFTGLGRNPLIPLPAVPGGDGGAVVWVDKGFNTGTGIGSTSSASWVPNGGLGGLDGFNDPNLTLNMVPADTVRITGVFEDMLGEGWLTTPTLNNPIPTAAALGASTDVLLALDIRTVIPGFPIDASNGNAIAVDVIGGVDAAAVEPNQMVNAAVVGNLTDIAASLDDSIRNLPGLGPNEGVGAPNVDWDTTSTDPVEFVSTPEPVAVVVWAGLFGILGLVHVLRRRRR